MNLTVLVDNNTILDEYYIGEHGLSFYIEDNDKKILFDLGYSNVLLENMKKLNGRAIAVSAMIAAVYTAVSLALSLASFGVVQIRVAECLTLLPVLSPLGIYGVTVGCLLTNLVVVKHFCNTCG